MPNSITAVALVVHDDDEAVHFFTHALRFTVVEDTPLPGGKRWVTVRPCGGGTALLLAKAATPEQSARVGDQAGGPNTVRHGTCAAIPVWVGCGDVGGLLYARPPRSTPAPSPGSSTSTNWTGCSTACGRREPTATGPATAGSSSTSTPGGGCCTSSTRPSPPSAGCSRSPPWTRCSGCWASGRPPSAP